MFDNRTNLREDIRVFLKENKLKKYEFCKILDISRSTLNDYEHQKRHIPNHIKMAIMYLTENKIKFNVIKSEK